MVSDEGFVAMYVSAGIPVRAVSAKAELVGGLGDRYGRRRGRGR